MNVRELWGVVIDFREIEEGGVDIDDILLYL